MTGAAALGGEKWHLHLERLKQPFMLPVLIRFTYTGLSGANGR
jgi:hypothetical protein